MQATEEAIQIHPTLSTQDKSLGSQCRQTTAPLESAHHGLRWEKGLGEPVEVAQVELDAGVGDSELVDVGGAVLWADVTLAREGGHRDGVLKLIERQVV